MIHVMIARERRAAPRELAILIAGTQLHTMGEKITDMTNIIYAAEWDGKTPWITVLKGNIADLKMAYMGWPLLTEAEWKAANPVAP